MTIVRTVLLVKDEGKLTVKSQKQQMPQSTIPADMLAVDVFVFFILINSSYPEPLRHFTT